MPQIGNCLAPPQPPAPIAPTLTLKVGQLTTQNSISNADSCYTTYEDIFDLSLLPQDCATTTTTTTTTTNIIENIPTTLQKFANETKLTTTKTITKELHTPLTPQTPPQIKIEQSVWTCATNEIKKEHTHNLFYEQLNSNNLLPIIQKVQQNQSQQQPQHQQQMKTLEHILPPPAYPYIYPSPQSSPAQSEYGFPNSQFANCYDSLSSSRTSLYASSPCPSIDAHSIKQELHILPPSPPESNCEAPSPHSMCTDIKTEPIEADVENLIDLKLLLEKQSYGDFKLEKKFEFPTFQQQPLQQLNQQQQQQQQLQQHQQIPQIQQQNNNQLLREYLEDTTFQKKHNLKPLALESFIGGLEEVRGDIEPVISLALEHAKRDAEETCVKLQISRDPNAWSTVQVHSWLRSTIAQFDLPLIKDLETKFTENGAAFMLLTEEEFTQRAPESGSILHAQLEIWRLAYTDSYQANIPIQQQQQQQQQTQKQQEQQEQQQQPQQQTPTNEASLGCTPGSITILQPNNLWNGAPISSNIKINKMDIDEQSDDDDVDSLPSTSVAAAAAAAAATNTNTNTNASATVPTTTVEVKRTGVGSGRTGGSHIHLWQFLKELLSAPQINGTAIRWIDRSQGIFKIEDSVRVAKLWGRRKNRPAMNYDKLSRSIRQYYKKGIMKKTERSQRLVYQFCHPFYL